MGKVRIKMDPTQKILLKRSLNENGGAQRFFTSEMQRVMHPYVPVLESKLRDSSVIKGTCIEYNTPYARRQFYENQGNGIEGMNNGGRAGSQWAQRAWADNGDAVVESVADYVGGRAR